MTFPIGFCLLTIIIAGGNFHRKLGLRLRRSATTTKPTPIEKGPGNSGSGKVGLGEGGVRMSASVIEAVFDIRALTIHGGPGQAGVGQARESLADVPGVGAKRDCNTTANSLIA